MNRPDQQTDEHPTDDIAEQLAAFDDSVQLHSQPPLPTDVDASTAELQSTILRLERHWPRSHHVDNESTDLTSLGQPLKVGRFEIQHEIGRGGFGVVFLALDPQLNRRVALKVPRPESLLDPDRQQRFASEAEAAASLDHPAIVPIYEANHSGPTPYIASAYYPGSDLGQWLAKHKRVENWRSAVSLIAILAEGIQHAHDKGVYHRDIKPSNILLVKKSLPQRHEENGQDLAELQEYEPRLTDFGLAKIAESSLSDTRSSLMVGSPLYMAPEQLTRSVDTSHMPAIDIYALGCLLFELLSGQTPHSGSTYIEILDSIRHQKPQRLSDINPGLPTDLCTICHKCLQKEPGDRYQSVREFRDDLLQLISGKSITAKPPSWSDLLLRWTRRSERIAKAGAFAFWFQLVVAAWMVGGLTIGYFVGSIPEGTAAKTALDFIITACASHLPLAWLGWHVSRVRLWAFWPALLMSAALIGVFVVSLTTGSVAFEHLYPSIHSKVSVYLGLILGTALQLGLFLLAIPAWKKQRSLGTQSEINVSRFEKQNIQRLIGVIALLLGVIFFIGAWAAATIFKVDAKKGTLTVKVADENFETTAKNQEITIKNIETNEEYKIRLVSLSQVADLPSGKYQFLLSTSSGLTTNTQRFAISEGQDKQVEVWLEPKDVMPSSRKQPFSSEAILVANANSENYALSFDGVDDYVEISSLKYDGRHPLTIECLARPTGQDDRTQKFVISNGDYVDEIVKGFSIYQRGNKYPKPEFSSWAFAYSSDNGRSGNLVASQKSWNLGEKTHIAVVVHGKKWRFFIDGKLWRHGTLEGKPSKSDQPFMIGRDPFFKGFFRGHVDEVRLSKAARYKKNFKPKVQFKPDRFTMALYHFDSGSGSVLKDASGNEHHGKIHGATWINADGTPLSNTVNHTGHSATTSNLATENEAPKLTVFAPTYTTEEIEELESKFALGSQPLAIQSVDSMSQLPEDDSSVLVIVMDKAAFSKVGKYSPKQLKNRKIIGIGYGAATLFGELDLLINGGACAHGVFGTPRLVIQDNELLDKAEFESPFNVFDPPIIEGDKFHSNSFFGVYVGEKKQIRRELLDIIALQTRDKNYAPIIRQGNHILVCIDAPADKWSNDFSEVIRSLTFALENFELGETKLRSNDAR